MRSDTPTAVITRPYVENRRTILQKFWGKTVIVEKSSVSVWCISIHPPAFQHINVETMHAIFERGHGTETLEKVKKVVVGVTPLVPSQMNTISRLKCVTFSMSPIRCWFGVVGRKKKTNERCATHERRLPLQSGREPGKSRTPMKKEGT